MTNIHSNSYTIGRKVKQLMGFYGVSQRTVAEAIGVAPSTVSQKCAGRISFTADEIATTADLLNVSTDVLLGSKPLEVK